MFVHVKKQYANDSSLVNVHTETLTSVCSVLVSTLPFPFLFPAFQLPSHPVAVQVILLLCSIWLWSASGAKQLILSIAHQQRENTSF